MRIEQVTLSHFRCFGPNPVSIDLSQGLTAFIGANGSGKTAVLQALSRLFGVTSEQRRVRRQDFHVPSNEGARPTEREFSIEVILDFPELRELGDGDDPDRVDIAAVPEFFHQMAVDEQGNLKCRLRFDAQWTDDGSAEGAIESQFRAIRSLATTFDDADCSNITAADRTRIQMIYVPSVRDGESQVASFLRGRLWRAISWSDDFRETIQESTSGINAAFGRQEGVGTVADAVRGRWKAIAGTDVHGTPEFRPVDQRFEELIRQIEVLFAPGEAGRALEFSELSEGQRSLFHIAMTVAALDIEAMIRAGDAEGFVDDRIALPALTLIALEEPENSLAPFFLSRIVAELHRMTDGPQHAQAVISSHSASLLSRVPPDDVRHFRLVLPARTGEVRAISLPDGLEEAGKFVREAVRRYPELYFARFVVLGEGASEAVVIPRLAESLGVQIDKSFVAVVPLGGRHVNHFWRLLTELDIPYATLLDLDGGRAGGGWGRVKSTCSQLLANGLDVGVLFAEADAEGGAEAALAAFDGRELNASIGDWTKHLEGFGVFFASPLDLDMLMLKALPEAYQRVPAGLRGPLLGDDAEEDAEAAVLGARREPAPYSKPAKALFPWYRYLFLGRSKPDTHLRVLSEVVDSDLRGAAPAVLVRLVERIRGGIDEAPLVEGKNGEN